ncbi:MAG: TIGR03862 family flavoprotein [Alphaproteobacteria bacterium]|nr:TIGR03862 family flavoprotein [Alphaproteobacteria bacterium]
MDSEYRNKQAAIVGGGPAGLMAAEVLGLGGAAVTVYDAMPTMGRKLLMAGRGGLNLTHSEPLESFLARYGAAHERLAPLIRAFPPAALVAWAEGLGQPTFVGSSGRVFPRAMKASPLLRAWLARLAGCGVAFRPRHRWQGWTGDGALLFRTPAGDITARPDVTVLALGGASWPRLGADGGWAAVLRALGAPVTPLRPANCGYAVGWSDLFRDRFAGQPLKNVALACDGATSRGDAVVTAYGIEGGALYALGPAPREAVARDGSAVLHVDLRPDMTAARLAERLARPRRGQSLSNFLRKAAALSPVEVNLMREASGVGLPAEAAALAAAVKDVALILTGTQPLARAISTAGGLGLDGLDDDLMLRALPGVYAAGEMLDWEAPTGGYLLQACFATGRAAGEAALRRLAGA